MLECNGIIPCTFVVVSAGYGEGEPYGGGSAVYDHNEVR